MCTLTFTSRQFFRALGVQIRPRKTEVQIHTLVELLLLARCVEPSAKSLTTTCATIGGGMFIFHIGNKDQKGEEITVEFVDEISATNFLFMSLSNGKKPIRATPRSDFPAK